LQAEAPQVKFLGASLSPNDDIEYCFAEEFDISKIRVLFLDQQILSLRLQYSFYRTFSVK
jgi:hypothetical protein